MYEPAGEINEVGGDFYEAFPVEGGWAVLLGDVSGKGAAAAAVTAEARHTIRTAGTLAADPVAGLHLLDEATCAAATTSPSARSRCWSSPTRPRPEAEALVYLAGHPHPILLRAGAARSPSASPGRCSGWSMTRRGSRSRSRSSPATSSSSTPTA